MEIPVDRWYEAIEYRSSRRSFEDTTLKTEDASALEELCANISDSVDDIKLVYRQNGIENVFRGAMGKIIRPSAYVALIGDAKEPNIQEKLGYAGECIVLEATSLGVGSCWIGGFFSQKGIREELGIGEDEFVPAVIALGYASEKKSISEKLIKGLSKSSSRKDVERISEGLAREKWPEWAKSAVEAARLAPSAINRQPWIFEVGDGFIKVMLDNPDNSYSISKRLDCGIAMLHIELGARHKGARGSWRYLEHPDVAVYEVEEIRL